MSRLVVLFVIILSFSMSAFSQSTKDRNYPGGVDEEDLQVQKELTEPTAKIDRRTLEQRALNSLIKSNPQQEEKKPN